MAIGKTPHSFPMVAVLLCAALAAAGHAEDSSSSRARMMDISLSYEERSAAATDVLKSDPGDQTAKQIFALTTGRSQTTRSNDTIPPPKLSGQRTAGDKALAPQKGFRSRSVPSTESFPTETAGPQDRITVIVQRANRAILDRIDRRFGLTSAERKAAQRGISIGAAIGAIAGTGAGMFAAAAACAPARATGAPYGACVIAGAAGGAAVGAPSGAFFLGAASVAYARHTERLDLLYKEFSHE